MKELSIFVDESGNFGIYMFFHYRQHVHAHVEFSSISPSLKIVFKCFVTTLLSTPNSFAIDACVNQISLIFLPLLKKSVPRTLSYPLTS